ncbi:MAG: hypothetical protein LBL80_02550 [Ruminococcus sp.]|jgi:hypothetical protein|nr:hypothetical protein [Ruminococcus sp.]
MNNNFKNNLLIKLQEIKSAKGDTTKILGRLFAEGESPEFKNTDVPAKDISPYLAGNDIVVQADRACSFRYADTEVTETPNIVIV